MKPVYCLILFLFLCSCSTVERYEDTSARQAVVAAKIVESESEAVQASKDSIAAKDYNLATRFDDAALSLLGNPSQKIDVSKLIQNIKVQDAYFLKLQNTNADLETQNNKLLAEKADLQKQVINEAQNYESEQRQKTFWKWLFSFAGLATVGGIIALLCFFPELIPILSEIAGIIVGNGYRIIKNILGALVPKPTLTTAA